MDDKINIVIFLDGGLVQGVIADCAGVKVAVIDLDTEGVDEDELIKLHTGGEAVGYLQDAPYAPASVMSYFEDIPRVRR